MFLKKIKSSLTSLRARLTALYVALLAATLLIFCAILYQVFVSNHEREFDNALHNYAVDVSQTISVDMYGNIVFSSTSMVTSEKIFPFTLGRTFVQAVTLEGSIVNRSWNLEEKHLPLYSQDWQEVFQRGAAFRTLTPSELTGIKYAQPGAKYRQITLMVRRGPPLFVLQIAVPMSLLVQESSSLLLFFLIGIPTTLLIAGLAGMYLANKALEPVREIVLKAEQLNPSNLSQRLPEPSTEDEIQKLTVTLNGLLGRIERAFESHENFIADASHQLKTPVAILRGELDVFKSKPRSPEEMDAFTESASHELLHMSRLLDNLLLLAKIDAGSGTLVLREVRLDEVLLETVARIEVLAKRKNISIRFNLEDQTAGSAPNDFLVNGDSDLIQSMFRNLIDNAIKYSKENSSVEVTVINEANRVLTKIKDFGDSIPKEVLDNIFHRYERGNWRVSGVAGTGLGLTIARRIAEMHGGKILILQDNSPGKVFQVEMKKF